MRTDKPQNHDIYILDIVVLSDFKFNRGSVLSVKSFLLELPSQVPPHAILCTHDVSTTTNVELITISRVGALCNRTVSWRSSRALIS